MIKTGINKFKVALLLVSSGALMMAFQNCSNNLSSDQFNQPTTDVSDGLDTNTPNNKPIIDCRFGSQQRSAVFANINSLQDSYSTDRFNEDDSVTLDCSNTNDESSISQLTFELDTDYDINSPNFQSISPSNVNLSNLPPGRYDMALRVTDPEGAQSMKVFSMAVECTTTSAADPQLLNPSSSVSVTEGNNPGSYTYSINTANLRNGTSYTFAWDFNGDGVMDPYDVVASGSRNLWTTSASVTNQYVNVKGNRNITLKVQNQCLREATYFIDKNLVTSHPIGSNDAPTVLGYRYLQGDVSDTSSSATPTDTKRRNAEYLAIDAGARTEFTCDYNWNRNSNLGSLEIATSKQYRDESYSSHGAMIYVNQIPDDGSTSSGGSSNMQRATYTLAGESDGIVTERFSMSQGCTVDVTINRTITVGNPCGAGQSGTTPETHRFELLGTFNCPELTSNAGNTIAIDNGKFFCTERLTFGGCGGGGGGGGDNPPQF